MSFGHYLIAKDRGILLEVQPNEISFLNISDESERLCLATRNLNSCHVVLIVSQFAALFAHIAPRLYANPLSPDSEYHVNESMMSSFCTLYCQHQHLFPMDSTWIGIGTWGEEAALPHQEAVIENMLGAVGLYPLKFHYQNAPATISRPAGKGLVLVDGRAGKLGLAPSVYFEYMLITGTRLPSPEGEILDGYTLVRGTRLTGDEISGYRVRMDGQTVLIRDYHWRIRRGLGEIDLVVSDGFRLMIMPEDW
ncbi:hypothetical protein BDV97DRAFT_394150 [Delphinella strobiligena]|nr:hypothetical protein BDV97DRAFT_394150 [Delphinella strobiligena]